MGERPSTRPMKVITAACYCVAIRHCQWHHLLGWFVGGCRSCARTASTAYTSRAGGLRSFPAPFWSSCTNDLRTGPLVAVQHYTWLLWSSSWTGYPGVSLLLLDQTACWFCNFYLSVAARKTVIADPSPRHTSRVAGTLSNQPTTTYYCASVVRLFACSSIRSMAD